MALGLIPTSKSLLGRDITCANIGKLRRCFAEQSYSRPRLIRLIPGLEKCLDQGHESDDERARCYIPRGGPKAQRAWFPVSYSVLGLESEAQ